MTDSPPKPKRRRWIVAGALLSPWVLQGLWTLAVLVMLTGIGLGQIPDPETSASAEQKAFLIRVQAYDFDQAITALGTNRDDSSAVHQPVRSSDGKWQLESRFHQILRDYRVAKLRSLIAAMPEADRCTAAVRAFDLQIENYESRLKPIPGGKERGMNLRDYRLSTYGIHAGLFLCLEFCPPEQVLEKLDSLDPIMELGVHQLAPGFPHESEVIHRLFAINVMIQLLERQKYPAEKIQMILGPLRENLNPASMMVWDVATNDLAAGSSRTEKDSKGPIEFKLVSQFDERSQRDSAAELKIVARLRKVVDVSLKMK